MASAGEELLLPSVSPTIQGVDRVEAGMSLCGKVSHETSCHFQDESLAITTSGGP